MPPPTHRMRRVICAGILWGLVPCAASAQPASTPEVSEAPEVPELSEAPWALGFSLSGGGMLSNDQREQLDLGGGGTARVSLTVRPLEELGIDWIEGEVRGGFSVIGAGRGQPGGILALELAVRASPELTAGIRLPIALGVGLGFTGPLVRPVGSATVGLTFAVTGEVSVGPEVTLLHVLQSDGPAFTDDALLLSGGLTLLYRPLEGPPPPAPPPEAPRRAVVARPPPPPEAPPFHLAPRVPPPADHDELLYLVERAVPGSTLAVVLLVPPVLFDHDADVITPAGEVSLHDVLERIAAADPSARIVVEGHADVTGEVDYNLTLSRHRAEAVAAWLEGHGVPRERMRITAEGALRPLVTGDSTETLAPNRRVTIRIESHPVEEPEEVP